MRTKPNLAVFSAPPLTRAYKTKTPIAVTRGGLFDFI